MTALKQQLYRLCGQYIAQREAAIKSAIDDLREATANETKSSAGDKYETDREMLQQEIDIHTARLAELRHMRLTLQQIIPEEIYTTVQQGALVHTSDGNYYIAISAGHLKIAGVTYYAISSGSPVGMRLLGLKKCGSCMLNGKTITIKDVT